MINTIIICPQRQDREKIKSRLSGERDISVSAQGKDGYDALKLVNNHKPDIAILDNNLAFIDGEEIPPLLRARSPDTAVVIIIAKISDYQLIRAASNEVSGFVNKETDIDTLPWILKLIYEGKCFISPVLASRVLNILSSTNNIRGASVNGFTPVKNKTPEKQNPFDEEPEDYLSKTELRVLLQIGKGYTSQEIAGNLGLVVGTVRNYISSVMHKTGMNSRSQLVRYAIRCGLISVNSSYYFHEKGK